MQSGQTKNGVGMTVAACLWLGLFPLMQFGTYSSITKDKWTCMLILTAVTAACFFADMLCRRLSKPRLLPLVAGAALIAWMTVSSLACPYPNNPWWLGAGRREGLATQLCYLGVFFMFLFSRVRRGPVLVCAGAGLCGFAAVVLLQRTGGNPLGLYPKGYSFENAPHFQGTIGNIDMCSGYLLILCGLFFPALVDQVRALFRTFRKTAAPAVPAQDPGAVPAGRPARTRLLRLLCILALLFLLAACVWLFITMDVRTGLLTLAVLIGWTFVRFLPKKFRVPVLILLIAAVLAFAWYYPGQNSTLYELHEVLHGRARYTFGSGRVGTWIYCAKLLSEGEHLLLGTGPDTFVLRFNNFLNKYFDEHPDAERLKYYYDNPHNDYLALLLNCGIPAVLLFLVLMLGGCFGREVWRDAVLCYGIQLLLSFSICMIAPMFWAVLGIAWSKRSREPSLPAS